MKILFIVNPVAGGGKGLRVWREVEAALGQRHLPADYHFTTGSGSATELARAAREKGYDAVVGVGGDGTIQEIVNGLIDSRRDCPSALGVIPGGTGNDFRKMLGYPSDPLGALDVVVGGKVRRLDVGSANGRLFINIMGVGFDAEVAGFLNRSPKRLPGVFMYLYGIVVMLFRYRPAPVSVTMTDEHGTRTVEQKCLLVSVGNGNSHAGGLKMCPEARPDDGVLDVLIAGDLSRPETLAVLPKLPSGRHTTHPKIEIYRATTVRIESTQPLVVQADGEILGRVPVTVEVLPGALRVIGS